MFVNLTALFVDADPRSYEALCRALEPECYFLDRHFCPSLHEALQFILAHKVHVCFIAMTFDAKSIHVFRADTKKLEHAERAAFVLVDETAPDEAARSSVKSAGFETVISRAVDPDDKRLLSDILTPLVKYNECEAEIKKKVLNVRDAIQVLLRELDRVAMDRKHSIDSHFDHLAPDFIAELSEFHDEVLQRYYAMLSEQLKDASVPEGFCNKLTVPEDVLKKRLPALSRDNYSGASRRTWKKLVKLFGQDG